MGVSVKPDPVADYLAAKQGAASDPVSDYLNAKTAATNHGASGTWGDEPRTPSTLENVSRAVLQGATLGLSTKPEAAVNALIDKVRGAPSFSQAYQQRLADERQASQGFARQHPLVNAGLEVAGGLGSVLASGGASAPQELANVGRLARIAKAGATGFDIGATSGFVNADGGIDERVRNAAKEGTIGGIGGVVLAPAMELGGYLANKARIPQGASYLAEKAAAMFPDQSSAQRALQTLARATGNRGQAATEIGQRMQMDQAAGVPAAAAAPGVPTLALDQGGANVEGLAKGVVRRPGPGGAIIKNALTERQAQMRPAVTQAFDAATGTNQTEGEALLRRLASEQEQVQNTTDVVKAVTRENAAAKPATITPNVRDVWQSEVSGSPNGIAALRQQVDEQAAQARQLYGAAREATRGQPVQSETLDQIMQTPAGKSAFGWAKMQQANRGNPLPTVATPPKAPPGFSQDQWNEILAKGGQSIRDESGKLRANLGNVHDDALEEEWRRLAELNATEEALHTGVQTAGYREEYNALPRTERLGAKGQEDLPDADGNVDPDVLAADNKIVKDYNKSQIVRAARTRAMDRIQAEQAKRQGGADFNFGANATGTPSPVEGGTEVPDPETLHYMKQALAKMARLGVNDGAQGTIATQAQGALGVWGKIRSEFPEVWQQADAAYATKARIIDALNQGRNLMRTQLNPAGRGQRALFTSLDAVQQQMANASPAEQQAFKVGAQSAISDYFKSGGSTVGFAKQLADPASAMSRRVALALGDEQAPQRIAAKLAPTVNPQQLLAPPPVPSLAPESRAASTGLDVLRYGASAPGNAPERSLPVLAQRFGGMLPTEQNALRGGAAQALRGDWMGASGSVKSPGRVFDFASPERAQQMAYAFPTPEAQQGFQRTVGGWDEAAARAQRIMGGSDTQANFAEQAARDRNTGSVLSNLFHLRPGAALRSLAGGVNDEATSAARQSLDTEIARILSSGNSGALNEAMRSAQFRQRLQSLLYRGAGAESAMTANDRNRP